MKTVIKFLATACFTGYIPFAPGTMGTLFGALVYWFCFPQNNIMSFIIVMVVIAASVHICGKAEDIFQNKDDQRIVLDEVAGIFVSMLFLPHSIAVLLAGIVLFRIFDIWKPLFINKSQKLKGGLGVVADDVFAGVFANIILWIILAFR
jgi:phosphatidylglycerophosphatase A